MPDDLLLPEGAHLLHIGPQKTGTTAIQVAMAEAREAMAQAGVHYPVGDYRRRAAGWALGLPGGPAHTPISEWQDLVAEVAAAGSKRVCVSDENFSRAEAPVVARIVEELGGDEPHVVAVVRRLDRFLPSQWQERVKAGKAAAFDDWLHAVLDDEAAPNWERWNVWMGHDIEALVARWVGCVGAERFTLVVSDEADRRQLADVFEAMLGLPTGTLQLHPDRSNHGFGLAEVELLRRLRIAFDRNGWGEREYFRLVRRGVRRRIAARPERSPGPAHAPIPAWAVDRLRELSNRRADVVPNLGVRIVGDPESLRLPADVAGDDVDLDALTVPVDLAVEAIETAIARQREVVRGPEEGDAVPARDLSARALLKLASLRVARRLGRP